MGQIVITSIQAPTPSVRLIADIAIRHGAGVIIAGDAKTPPCDWPPGVRFISLEDQSHSGAALSKLLPTNHYARKNLGYLAAIAANAPWIYDTDDDNAPLPLWRPRMKRTVAQPCLESGWVNAYRWFSDAHIWPRGLPLDMARLTNTRAALGSAGEFDAPIQQGLANGSPDVDAVWRLLMDQEVAFADHQSVFLGAGTWCPFNSQSTWWFPEAYPLLYLPSFVSFRMTDIWRSFVAQRCLWALGRGVVFHAAEVFQDRNPHNLLRDFQQEIPGYLQNDRFREVLGALDLAAGTEQVGTNLRRCYEALVAAELLESREMPLVDAWLRDLNSAGAHA